MPGSPSLAVVLGPHATVNAGQAVPSFLPAAPKMPTLWVELLLLSSQSSGLRAGGGHSPVGRQGGA